MSPFRKYPVRYAPKDEQTFESCQIFSVSVDSTAIVCLFAALSSLVSKNRSFHECPFSTVFISGSTNNSG
jgi:hypothetical protein